MRLSYDLAGIKDDLYESLWGMSPWVQSALGNYRSKLLDISIIPDGNRRFSRQVGMKNVVEGHQEGAERLKDTLLHLRKRRQNVVDEVTFWGLSRQNNSRPKNELEGLFQLIENSKEDLLRIAEENSVHVFMMGNEKSLPSRTVDIMGEISEKTQQFNSTFRCALALAYDQIGEETRQRQLLFDGGFEGDQQELHMQAFKNAHRGLREPDLLIRAGCNGRRRTSGGFCGPNTAMQFFRAHWPTISTRHIDFALHGAIMEEINNGK